MVLPRLPLLGLALPFTMALALCIGCTAPRATPPPKLMAHRGVHQTFGTEGLTWESCTASMIRPPTHGFIENTLPSMEAAFKAGADMVELDVHGTLDGHLAVFHDHSLECRTNGVGAPEAHTLEALRSLDLGYGYTADGGQSYPLRGSGVGLLVTLPEVFEAFPEGRFMIHIKSGREEDGARVAAVLNSLPEARRAQQVVYGGEGAERVKVLVPEVKSWNKSQVKTCLKAYLKVGWMGRVPEACHDTWVVLPSNYTWLIWGWPRRFEARMKAVGSEVALAGPLEGGISTGFDSQDQYMALPEGFSGWLWTNRVELLGELGE